MNENYKVITLYIPDCPGEYINRAQKLVPDPKELFVKVSMPWVCHKCGAKRGELGPHGGYRARGSERWTQDCGCRFNFPDLWIQYYTDIDNRIKKDYEEHLKKKGLTIPPSKIKAEGLQVFDSSKFIVKKYTDMYNHHDNGGYIIIDDWNGRRYRWDDE